MSTVKNCCWEKTLGNLLTYAEIKEQDGKMLKNTPTHLSNRISICRQIGNPMNVTITCMKGL